MKLVHTRTQHAVGHGGFHSACIDDGEAGLRYAYDCGSTNLRRLAEVTRELAAGTDRLDFLFLSHLHADHSNGSDKLLDMLSVGTVVLPYLSPFERLLLVTEAMTRPGKTPTAASTLAMVSAPARWFMERGAQRILFVRAPEDDQRLPGAPPPGAPPQQDRPVRYLDIGGGDPRHEATRPGDRLRLDTRTPLARPATDEERKVIGEAGKGMQVMPSGMIPVVKGESVLWLLVPFVHPEPTRAPEFVAAVATHLGLPATTNQYDPKWLGKLKSAVATRSARRELAKLYETHIGEDLNLTSMCLFSGPPSEGIQVDGIGSSPPSLGITPLRCIPPRGPWPFPLFGPQPSPTDGRPRAGWMGTGDTHLEQPDRLKAFESFYVHVLGETGTIMLPHHGSRHNVKPSFISGHNGVVWVAAHRTGDKGHPDKHLIAVAGATGSAICVNEQRESEFTQVAVLEY